MRNVVIGVGMAIGTALALWAGAFAVQGWWLGVTPSELRSAALEDSCPGCVTLRVPVRRLNPGSVVAESDLAAIRLPPDYVPQDAVLNPAGHTVLRPLLAHAVVLPQRVSP